MCFSVPDESYFDAADLLGEVFVETDQTVSYKIVAFLETFLISLLTQSYY